MKGTNPNPISAFFALNNALKRLIHPPLPLTARDEQRLLGMLKSTFRKRLAASTVECKSGPSNPGDSSLPENETKFKSPAEEHFSKLLKTSLFKNPKTVSDAQDWIQQFMQKPLEVFDERALHGPPPGSFAASALRRYTENILKLPEAEREPNWAMKAINKVLTVYKHSHPAIHLTDDSLRHQTIRTLILGEKAHIAARLITKKWLLKVDAGEPGSEKKLDLRHQLVNTLVDVMENIKGRDSAAGYFLDMVELWKGKGGYTPDSHGDLEPTRLKQKSVLPLIKKSRIPLNPFQTKSQYFLIHYARVQVNALTAETASVRKEIFKTCFPWVRNQLIRCELTLYYIGNPYPLYWYLMKAVSEAENKHRGQSETWLLLRAHACLQVTLALAERKAWAKAYDIVRLMHDKLDGRISGLDPAMSNQIKEMLHSPELSYLLKSTIKRVFELLQGFGTTHLSEFWKGGITLEPESSE